MSELRSEAARLMGQASSEKKAAAVRENGKKGGAHPMTPELRAAISEGQRKRWERIRAEKVAEEIEE